MKNLFTVVLCSAITIPAFASATISSPTNGETVTSPFTLSADASSCSSQSISSMGYSLDNSPDTTMFSGKSSIDTKVSASVGTHTVHVKAWGNGGAVCVTDAGITVSSVTGDASADPSIVPSSAISISGIHALSWSKVHDSGTPGSSSGSTYMVSSPSHSGAARKFATSFSNSGGERYSVSFGDDRTSTNFLYDAWIYVASPSSKLANIEMDLYQTMSNGETVLLGFQCDGYSGTWDYNKNTGTAASPHGTWVHSGAKCNPRNWSTGAWHHVQISYSRTSGGYVTYSAVWFDGAKSSLNVTAFDAHKLGWGSSLVTNFQVDGLGTGSATLYLGDLTLYRW